MAEIKLPVKIGRDNRDYYVFDANNIGVCVAWAGSVAEAIIAALNATQREDAEIARLQARAEAAEAARDKAIAALESATRYMSNCGVNLERDYPEICEALNEAGNG